MASENITVSHQSVQTAYFDLNSRTLVCPIWQDMDGDMYDLLMGHEVGHALETPKQGWHDALVDENGERISRKFKDFLNVLEDARIEKKIKRRYPGLGRSFAKAYKNLHEKNFFALRDVKLDDLNFIDRINVYFKLGSHMSVPWRSDWERDIVREVSELETWEQVVELAKRIFDYVKEEDAQLKNEQDLQEQQQQQRQQSREELEQDFQSSGDDDGDDSYDDDEDDSDYEDDIDGDDSEGSQDGENASGGSDGDESEQDAEDGDTEDSSGAGENQRVRGSSNRLVEYKEQQEIEAEKKDDEPESITDRAFRRRERELVNASGKVFLCDIPEANLDKIILSNQIVMNDLEKFIRFQMNEPDCIYKTNGVSFEALSTKCVRKFNNRNKKFIMHIFKEFDMRKRATDYARTSIARTGELNMNVLHKYRYSNDLFKKISVVQKGKSHGLIMFVDMSGSMSNILRNTIEQCLVLVSFCKLANIPFDVYGFSNDGYTNNTMRENAGHQFTFNPDTDFGIGDHFFHLKHLISSSLSGAAYRRSFNLLTILINEYDAANRRHYGYSSNVDNDNGQFQYDWTSSGFGLNGTPYLETLLASREIINKFRNEKKLDIVNVLYLTDGDGTSSFSYPRSFTWDMMKNSTIYFVDKKTQRKIRLTGNMQATLTEFVRDLTGCKHLGFYLADKREMKNALASVRRESELGINKFSSKDCDDMRRSVRENNFFVASNLGYDKYFYMTSSERNIEEDKLEITSDMTKTKMASAFKKSLGSKKSNRLLVSKFAEELATGL